MSGFTEELIVVDGQIYPGTEIGMTPAVSVNVVIPGLKAPSPECKHGSQRLTASMISSSILQCGSVAISAGTSISLSVSSDGMSFTNDFFVFHYVPGVSVLQILPPIGELGSINEIKVIGVGFRGQDWHCRLIRKASTESSRRSRAGVAD